MKALRSNRRGGGDRERESTLFLKAGRVAFRMPAENRVKNASRTCPRSLAASVYEASTFRHVARRSMVNQTKPWTEFRTRVRRETGWRHILSSLLFDLSEFIQTSSFSGWKNSQFGISILEKEILYEITFENFGKWLFLFEVLNIKNYGGWSSGVLIFFCEWFLHELIVHVLMNDFFTYF